MALILSISDEILEKIKLPKNSFKARGDFEEEAV